MNSRKSYTLQEAKTVLENYCAYQERSYQEVRQKLQNMGMVSEVQDAVLLHLLQHDFLNEERYAKAFAGGKFRIKKWGRIKITQALRQKGVSAANIKIGLAEIEEEAYLTTLREVAGKWGGLRQAQPDMLRRAQQDILRQAQHDIKGQDQLNSAQKNMFDTEEKTPVLAVNQLTFNEKQKLIRHLQQKGFELNLIYQYILNQ